MSQTFNLKPSFTIVFTLNPFVGSSTVLGASLLKYFNNVVLPALSKPKTNIFASLSFFLIFVINLKAPYLYILI